MGADTDRRRGPTASGPRRGRRSTPGWRGFPTRAGACVGARSTRRGWARPSPPMPCGISTGSSRRWRGPGRWSVSRRRVLLARRRGGHALCEPPRHARHTRGLDDAGAARHGLVRAHPRPPFLRRGRYRSRHRGRSRPDGASGRRGGTGRGAARRMRGCRRADLVRFPMVLPELEHLLERDRRQVQRDRLQVRPDRAFTRRHRLPGQCVQQVRSRLRAVRRRMHCHPATVSRASRRLAQDHQDRRADHGVAGSTRRLRWGAPALSVSVRPPGTPPAPRPPRSRSATETVPQRLDPVPFLRQPVGSRE